MAQTIETPNWADYTEISPYGQTGSLYRTGAGKYFVGKKGKQGGLSEIDMAGPSATWAQDQYNQYLQQSLPKQVAGQQQQLATEFRQNLPQYSGLLQDQANKTIQRNLAEKMRVLKQQSASRGLLGGTGTQRQQAEELVGAQQETQGKKFDIQDMLEKQAQTFENQALATRMSQQGSANQAYIDQLRQNILDTQRQGELWRALGQAIGPAIGTYLGSKSASSGTGVA